MIFIERSNYSGLLKFETFKIEDIEGHCFSDFLKFAPYNVIIHFLDRCNNLDHVFTDTIGSWNIVNYICRSASSEIVKYVLTKYPNLNYENVSTEGWRPIHQIASSYDGDCVKLLIDNGVNLLSRTIDNITGLEYIITQHDVDTIIYTLDHMDYIGDLDLSILFIRLEDNDKLTYEDKDRLRTIIISK